MYFADSSDLIKANVRKSLYIRAVLYSIYNYLLNFYFFCFLVPFFFFLMNY